MFRGLSPILAIRGVTPAVLVVAGLMVGACGDTRKVLGYDKVTPDEFKVVSRAPLSLPPDYGLRPPQPGALPAAGWLRSVCPGRTMIG